MSMAWDSQMPVSHARSGNSSRTRVVPVPSGMAAVQATALSSRVIRSVRASEKAEVKDRPPFLISTRQPTDSVLSTLKALGEWKVVASASATSRPLPLVVLTCRTMGRSMSRASVRNSMRVGRWWPSMGPTVRRLNFSNQESSLMRALVISPARW